jgi:5-formyltetrahydrofolate cyclo-ligase
MDMGVGFSEILLIVVLVLVFFGSKELPKFLRDAARLIGKVRRYGDKVRQELNEITAGVEGTSPAPVDIVVRNQKKALREKHLAARRALSPAQRSEKSVTICKHLMNSEQYKNAGAIMIYVNMGSEVETRDAVQEMLRAGKRVIVPYCKSEPRNLGIGEIVDLDKDIIIGEGKSPEPRTELRDRFLRSDLQLIICPGVGFDRYGARLGRGFAYYDNFLRELRGKVPMVGLAFDCQVQEERLPFSYSDVPMDMLITESGITMLGNG